MSRTLVKTKYNVTNGFGSIETHVLHAVHNNSTDIVTFFDENGKVLFTVEDTIENNLIDAIKRLYRPFDESNGGQELLEAVEEMESDDIEKCYPF